MRSLLPIYMALHHTFLSITPQSRSLSPAESRLLSCSPRPISRPTSMPPSTMMDSLPSGPACGSFSASSCSSTPQATSQRAGSTA